MSLTKNRARLIFLHVVWQHLSVDKAFSETNPSKHSLITQLQWSPVPSLAISELLPPTKLWSFSWLDPEIISFVLCQQGGYCTWTKSNSYVEWKSCHVYPVSELPGGNQRLFTLKTLKRDESSPPTLLRTPRFAERGMVLRWPLPVPEFHILDACLGFRPWRCSFHIPWRLAFGTGFGFEYTFTRLHDLDINPIE